MHHDAPWCTMMHLYAPWCTCTWSSYTKCPNKTPEGSRFNPPWDHVRPSASPSVRPSSASSTRKHRRVGAAQGLRRCNAFCEFLPAIYLHMIHIWFRYNIFRLNIASREEILSTSASVKSYQLVKVVSGGRAPGKSSSLASPQLLVIEQFHCFRAVRLEKVHFFYCVDFKKYIWSFIQGGAACLLLAAACCCLPVAAHLARRRRRQDGARRNRHNRRRRRSTDKTCHAFRPQWNEGFFPVRNSWVDRTTNFLRAVHDIDAHRASHRFGCGKQGAPISLYHPRS